MEGTSLDELFGGEPAEELEPIAEQPVNEPELEPEERPRDEHGRFAAKETGVEPQETVETVPPTDKLPQQDYKALREERDKRQRLEAELEALKAQVNQTPPPSIWEDEEAARAYDRNQTVSAAVQEATFQANLNMSEMMVRQANPDFEEVKAEFLALAQDNPALAQQALQDPHPWNKAYTIAKNARTMRELGATDIDSLREKIKAELMAEMQVQQPARSQLPPTLSTERSVGGRTGPAWTGPKSLDELFN